MKEEIRRLHQLIKIFHVLLNNVTLLFEVQKKYGN